ncbi:hypothetical protein GGX14DRAFT_620390, partial [Mycena pura]
RQRLANALNALTKDEDERGLTTGLNRSIRWKAADSTVTNPLAKKTGNAANAEVTAASRATAANKRRQTGFAKARTSSSISNAGVNTSRPLKTNSWGFAAVGTQIVLARVVTMYTKNGSKAAVHSFTTECVNIGRISYMVIQTYEHFHFRQFSFTRTSDPLQILRYAHIPSTSFLAIIP